MSCVGFAVLRCCCCCCCLRFCWRCCTYFLFHCIDKRFQILGFQTSSSSHHTQTLHFEPFFFFFLNLFYHLTPGPENPFLTCKSSRFVFFFNFSKKIRSIVILWSFWSSHCEFWKKIEIFEKLLELGFNHKIWKIFKSCVWSFWHWRRDRRRSEYASFLC